MFEVWLIDFEDELKLEVLLKEDLGCVVVVWWIGEDIIVYVFEENESCDFEEDSFED